LIVASTSSGIPARRIARPRERHERGPLGAPGERLLHVLRERHRLRRFAVERRLPRELDLREHHAGVELRRRVEAIDRVRVPGARERRPREELVPGVLARLVVPLRQERRGPDGVPLEEERRDAREREALLLDPDLVGARERVLERDLLTPLEEPLRRALVEPGERRARRARVELEGLHQLLLRRREPVAVGGVERLVDLRQERLRLGVLLRALVADVEERARRRPREEDRRRDERDRPTAPRRLRGGVPRRGLGAAHRVGLEEARGLERVEDVARLLRDGRVRRGGGDRARRERRRLGARGAAGGDRAPPGAIDRRERVARRRLRHRRRGADRLERFARRGLLEEGARRAPGRDRRRREPRGDARLVGPSERHGEHVRAGGRAEHRVRGGGRGVERLQLARDGGGASRELVVVVVVAAERWRLDDVHLGRRVGDAVHRRARRVERRGARDLGRDGAHPGRRLHRAEHLGALAPEARLGVRRAELQGALEDAHRAIGVAAAEEYLAEEPVHLRVARRGLPGGDERGLRVAEALRRHVHARRRQEHPRVARVLARGALADLLDERGAGRAAERFAERDRHLRVRPRPPPGGELVDRPVRGHS
jgi:hypothetical protein